MSSSHSSVPEPGRLSPARRAELQLELVALLARHHCHELNNRLTQALGQLSLLERELDPERVAAARSRAEKVRGHLDGVVAGVRALHRSVRGAREASVTEPLEALRLELEPLLRDPTRGRRRWRVGAGSDWSRAASAPPGRLLMTAFALAEARGEAALPGAEPLLEAACDERGLGLVFSCAVDRAALEADDRHLLGLDLAALEGWRIEDGEDTLVLRLGAS